MERADAADAEALCLRQLARIDDEAARGQSGVKIIEAETRILRSYKGDDDRCLDALVEKGSEPEASHPGSQGSEVLLVAPQPRGWTAFRLKEPQSLKERADNLHRWREPPLPVRFKGA